MINPANSDNTLALPAFTRLHMTPCRTARARWCWGERSADSWVTAVISASSHGEIADRSSVCHDECLVLMTVQFSPGAIGQPRGCGRGRISRQTEWWHSSQ